MENKVKIAVLVSGGGTNLQALIDAEKAGIIESGKISLVISNKADAYALERARNADIETAVVLRKDYADSLAFEEAIKALLTEKGIDVIVLAGLCLSSPKTLQAHTPKESSTCIPLSSPPSAARASTDFAFTRQLSSTV